MINERALRRSSEMTAAYPAPKRRASPKTETVIIAFSIVFAVLGGMGLYWFVPGCRVPSMIPIALSACMLLPYLILILLGLRHTFDMWAGFVYTGIQALLVSPIFYLATGETPITALGADFEPLIRVVAWSCVPMVPVFYLGYRLALRRRTQRGAALHVFQPDRAFPVGASLALTGFLAFLTFYIVIRPRVSGGGHGGLASLIEGPVLLVADGGSMGLMLIIYGYLVSLRQRSGRHLPSFRVLAVIACFVLLTIALNLWRGSRSHMLHYAIYAVILYSFLVRPVNLVVIVVGAILLIQPLKVYKAWKYEEYRHLTEFTFDASFREERLEEWGLAGRKNTLGYLSTYYIWMLYYRELGPNGNIAFQWGGTYVEAASQMIPRFLFPVKNRLFVSMPELTTDAEYGRGTWQRARGAESSAKIGGLWAEGYANFGFAGVYGSAFLAGWVLGMVKRYFATLPAGAMGHFFYPAFALVGGAFLGDSRLLVWRYTRVALMMALIYRFTSMAIYRRCDRSSRSATRKSRASGVECDFGRRSLRPSRGATWA